MVPHLEDEHPSAVMFAAGGNDLSEQDMPTEQIRTVADCLVNGDKLCKTKYGVDRIYISSVLPRSNSNFQGNRHRLNKMLEQLCEENDFTFINNSNIVLRPHGHYDGVHLNEEGSHLLHENFVNVLNK